MSRRKKREEEKKSFLEICLIFIILLLNVTLIFLSRSLLFLINLSSNYSYFYRNKFNNKF